MDNYCRTKTTFRSGCCDVPCTTITKEIGGVDDRKYPPANGEGFNTIVVYTKTGNVYIYDSYGIPTKIGGEVPLDDFLSLNSTNGVQNATITSAVNTLTSDTMSVRSSVDALGSLINSQYQDLSDRIDNIDLNVNTDVTVFDPSTGAHSPLQQVISNLYGWAQEDTITAGEFDALNPTAEEFDALDMSASNYDLNSKTILGADDTTSIAFQVSTLGLTVGEKSSQTVTVTPSGGATPIVFSSSAPEVATVTADGRTVTITAISAGSATISADAGALSSSLSLTVTAAA